MSNNDTNVIGKVVDSFQADPCYLLIIIVLVIAYMIIQNNNKHSEKMEQMRLQQFDSLIKKRFK